MSSNLPFDAILSTWGKNEDIAPNFCFHVSIPAQDPVFEDFPPQLAPEYKQALKSLGINQLYSHQLAAWQTCIAGENLVITSGTSSGKSLCYYLPILNRLITDWSATALLMFPTKALARDQLSKLTDLASLIPGNRIRPAVYDGDTPAGQRRGIRESANILITNPDMLHLGLLPHHTGWSQFLGSLQFVVLDEIHTYRGVFGSHVANVLRRLQRVAANYGATPQYILTSATIGNAPELARNLTGQQVTEIDEDGAGHGERNFFIYNPPVTNPELGIRKSPIMEAARLAHPLISSRLQTILFGRTRRSVEVLLTEFQQYYPDISPQIRGYRSGYLPEDRREIEKGLRENTITGVTATSALELGVDIGSLDASLLVGYPGTVASTTQQIGRAGRKSRASLAVLICSSDPVDQFLARNPQYLLGLRPENAMIDPDHLMILLSHLQCAAFELPFHANDSYGNLPAGTLSGLLDFLASKGILHFSAGKYFWMQSNYPSAEISLRNSTAEQIDLKRSQGDSWETFGTVDRVSAYWMVHPGAIYLHEGRTYLVDRLDLNSNRAELRQVSEDYYTEPQETLDIQITKEHQTRSFQHYLLGTGDLNVTNQVTGYKKIKNYTRETLGYGEVELPAYSFDTYGCWMVLKPDTVASLKAAGAWLNDPNDYGSDWKNIRSLVRQRDGYRCAHCGLPESSSQHHVHHKVPFRLFTDPHAANQVENLVTLCPNCHQKAEMLTYVPSGLTGVAYTLRHLLPLHLMCDTGDFEVHADPQSGLFNLQPAIIAFDAIPGGIGLARLAFEKIPEILPSISSFIRDCACPDGCPSCVGPAGEDGYGGKKEALAILEYLNNG